MSRLLHAVPHVSSSLKSVSQPSSGPLPSSALQSPKPELQVGAHVPPLQLVAEASALLHERPQVPQLAALVPSVVSQPSSGPLPSSALQSADPELQVGSHSPPLQLVAEAPALLHERPQVPQLAAVVPRVVSQPSSGPLPSSALQSPKPELQVGWHSPPLQLVVEEPALLHARLQAPQ